MSPGETAIEQAIDEELSETSQHCETILNSFSDLIPLYGSEYRLIKRLTLYSLIANRVKYSIQTLGSKSLDHRLHLLYIMPSGSGKDTFRRFITSTIQSCHTDGKNHRIQPSSLHPEQLVGKMIPETMDKKGNILTTKQKRGFLSRDALLIDEASALLTGTNYTEHRKHIREATSPIGDNEVYKELVNDEEHKGIAYFPPCSIYLFAQPGITIPQEVVREGTLRRFLSVYLEQTFEEHKQQFAKNIPTIGTLDFVNTPLMAEWISLLKSINSPPQGFRITEPALIYLHACIVEDYYRLAEQYEHGLELIQIFDHTLINQLYIMSAVRSIFNQPSKKYVVYQSNVAMAEQDHLKSWELLLKLVSRKLEGTLSNKPSRWSDEKHGLIMRNIPPEGKSQSDMVKYLIENWNWAKDAAYTTIRQLGEWGYIIVDKTTYPHTLRLREESE